MLIAALPLPSGDVYAQTWPAVQKQDQSCLDPLDTEYATVKRISDGDTLVLQDDRRVRLIGINTAELNAKSDELRDYAQAAKTRLRSLLPKSERVVLYLGKDAHDQHGRLLAHVVRQSDALPVAHDLLKSGLAAQVSVAPNTSCTPLHAALESSAVSANRGIWQDTHLWQLDARALTSNMRGFRLVRGEVTSITAKNKHTELMLDNTVQLRVRKSLAGELPLQSLKGKRIEIRGWLGAYKNQLRMRLHHPANLRVLTN